MLNRLRIVNKPEVSTSVKWIYQVLVIFIATLMVFFAYASFFTPMGSLGIAALIGTAIVEAIILLILRSLNKTRYIITERELQIETTKLIGGEKIIPLEEVQSVEKTLIPFGIKLFGASFHGGYYNIPGLGRAYLTITNFKDGLLIKTRNWSYIITPKDPLSFKDAIETKIFI